MKTLSETWFADGYIDFELKKFTLLSWLQEIDRYFNENRLYPQLSDLIFHYNNLIAFRENKEHLQQQFPRQLNAVNLQKLRLIYERVVEDDELMQELEEIIHYSIRKMKPAIDSGAQIHEFIEEKLQISPVGIQPIHSGEGYLFLANGQSKDTLIYQYRITIFEKAAEKYRGISTEYLLTRARSIAHTYESMKGDLIRNRSQLPNPAVYCVESPASFPVNESLLPIAKKSLVKYITRHAA